MIARCALLFGLCFPLAAAAPVARPAALAFTYWTSEGLAPAQFLSITDGGNPATITGTSITQPVLNGVARTVFLSLVNGTNPIFMTIDVSALGASGLLATGGTCSGSLRVVTAGGMVDVALSLTVALGQSGSALTVIPSGLTFGVVGGGSVSAQIQLFSTFTQSAAFTVVAATANGSSWLGVSPASGVTPAAVQVNASAAGLAGGTYVGTVIVMAAGTTVTVPVTLIVTPVIRVVPSTLSFNYSTNDLSVQETLQIIAAPGPQSYTATIGSPWLKFTSTNQIFTAGQFTDGQATIQVQAAPAGLAPGTYATTLMVNTATGGASVPVTINIGVNDDVTTPSTIRSLPYRITQSIVSAAADGADPIHSCTSVRDYNTVWFRYTAEFTGKLLATTWGSGYDTVLSAYGGLTGPGTELKCNNNTGGGTHSRIEFDVVAGQNYWIEVSSYGSAGSGNLALTVDRAEARIGIVRGATWYVDGNGNGVFDNGVDRGFDWSAGPGTIFVAGDWNGDGKSEAGFYKNGLWYLDGNGNGVWEPGTDKLYGFGWNDACVVPVTGDWNGDGRTKVGVFCNGFWYLDYNGNGVWDGSTTDRLYGWGSNGVTPLVGDWNGDGKSKIGFYVNGLWYLDYNGNAVWEPGADRLYGWGWNGVIPVVGDWSGDGKTKIGFYVNGLWYLDYNGNGVWEPGADKQYGWGWSGVTPVVGDWNGDGKVKVGAFINGFWYLDYNGDGIWNGAITDRLYGLGQAGDLPAIGRW